MVVGLTEVWHGINPALEIEVNDEGRRQVTGAPGPVARHLQHHGAVVVAGVVSPGLDDDIRASSGERLRLRWTSPLSRTDRGSPASTNH